ncbi:MAG: LmeA family phospholipid-binding protein [Gordonia sp. (in: high G+C Gram-positive bacteria)]
MSDSTTGGAANADDADNVNDSGRVDGLNRVDDAAPADDSATTDSAMTADRPAAPDAGAPADDTPTGDLDPAAFRTASIPPATTSSTPVPPAGPSAPTPPADRPSTRAYSEALRPSTRQLPAEDGPTSMHSSPSVPMHSSPSAPRHSSPEVPVASSPEVPVVKSAPSRRGKWRTVGLISAAVVLLLVIGSVGSELYIRHRVSSCIQTAFTNLTGTPTDVSISRRPMLFAWFGGDVPWVQVDTVDGDKANTTTLHVRAENVSSDGTTVKSLRGHAFVSYDRVSELASESKDANPKVESITGDAGSGTIEIKSTFTLSILSVPAEVTVKPVLKDGQVEFEVQKASALVFGLPNDFAQNIVDQVSDGMMGPMFKQIKVENLKVTNKGMDFAFEGENVNLRDGAEVSGGSGAAKC